MIEHLPVVLAPDEGDPPSGLGADHPMRAVTRAVAFDPDGWSAARRAEVVQLFDELAPEWHERGGPGRESPLRDALARGLGAAPAAERASVVDVGAGTGLYTQVLASRFPLVISVDLSGEMLRHAAAGPALLVQADASVLPVADGSIDALVLANAFVFPSEVERVLAATGVVIWVNSRGEDTPIHLTADEVDRALPGRWRGVASRAGWGTWSVHWREPVADSPD